VCVGVLVVLIEAQSARTACTNPVACENALPGDAPSDWQVNGVGDSSVQGFATAMSVDVGQAESFKITNTGGPYTVDILRLGYYGGDGARKVAAGLTATSVSQPACSSDASTGLVDCGNWSVSASWTVPTNAVSGVYIAHLVPASCAGAANCGSQIPFVVRDDASHSDIMLSTSDSTWEAYNDYGGNSLYNCTNRVCPAPAIAPAGYVGAYAVSYNRPFDGGFVTDGGASYLWYAEYQMIRFMEENGYDVSYTSSSDVDRDGAALLNHKIFISSAHDEYWSAGQRANVTAARNAGVNLAFFSGNEVFWKTRWTNNYRTLITYKETHFLDAPNYPQTQRADPADPPTWTGAWADPRGAQLPGEDGGQPQNSLTGQLFIVNAGTGTIQVPYQYSKLRMWRGTAIAGLASGGSAGLGLNTLGYEWDINDNTGDGTPLSATAAANRPPGEIELSQTTLPGVQVFTDFGTNVASGVPETHHLTLYRAPSGALVFGAGTVQWSWALDTTNAWGHAGPSGLPDRDAQQATVNLFADMGAQPATLIPGLAVTCPPADATPPTSAITADSGGVITGTATDAGGGVVAGVEVSTNGGQTWSPATLSSPDGPTVTWTYSGSGTARSRATNDSGYTEGISYARQVAGCGGTAGGSPGGTATSTTSTPAGGTTTSTTSSPAGGTTTSTTSTRAGGTTTSTTSTPAGSPFKLSPTPSSPPGSRPGTGGSGQLPALAHAARLGSRRLIESRLGRVTLSITNPNPVAVRGKATLTGLLPSAADADEDGTTIGAAHFTAHRRSSVKVVIRLSQRARFYLRNHRYLEAGLAVVLTANRSSKVTAATIFIRPLGAARRTSPSAA
jgi:hypothetical protein